MSRPETHRFNAMGCEVVLATASASAVREVEQLLRRREETFSRFIPGSELNRVNASAGRSVHVSHEFATMLRIALEAASESDGLVDPTLSVALVDAGYDADLALLRDDGRLPTAGPVGCWRGVGLVPAGVELDLNGVVKGASVDDALALSVSADGCPREATSPPAPSSSSHYHTERRCGSNVERWRRAVPTAVAGRAPGSSSTT
jgi:thiamine biosynthesis lipoprotein